MLKPHRCPHCGKRSYFKMWLDEYIRPPKCKHCPSKKLYMLKAEYKEQRIRNKKDVCYCDGYHFPHRKASKYCIHNPVGYQEQELRHYGY